MNELAIKIAKGAVSGFLAAFVVDIQAWMKATGKFDWGVAIKRWISGAISGALAALGIAEGGL